MKKSTITIIAVTIVLAAGAFWYFFAGSGNEAPLTANGDTQTAAQTQFQSLVEQLQTITFDTSIFSNPKFSSLVDITTPVLPEPAGRTDPFASVGR